MNQYGEWKPVAQKEGKVGEENQDAPRDLSYGLQVSLNHHQSVQHMARHFGYGHLPPELREVSKQFAELGQYLVDHMRSGPELTEALRKLWESKNSAVLHAGFLEGLRKPSDHS
ncbi:MAG TPA: hypothetical protein VGI71_23955 [Scandinavium sp.]|jgi:1-aminocyclopropane-1-carboxylate deaminase/D-cysteine desulfhydrase-like pyridoxal-dependent ACC family enzyme